MVQQLLVNLIENATRYAGDGAAISVRVSVEAGGTALVVADTGPGIVPELRHRVLEPFFRVGPERSTPGTGLGLALVKAIVERHRATITLNDNLPGLRVTVSFPAALSDRA
jgi:signal transduction histidine kinase